MNIEEKMTQIVQTLMPLKGAALREKFREVVGTEPTGGRKHMIQRIAYEIWVRDARKKKPVVDDEGHKTRLRHGKDGARDPRLPPAGTVLEREYKGKTVRATVLDRGFEYRGKKYRSLSAIAQEVTGTMWNGMLFFHLIKQTRGAKARSA
jgi:DUF2924 family protein